ncbi:hypothetical protein DFH28DRAFT_1078605 [Melampsora americana]|nr:hypothetical protein DFH28DRAFT_1078605 [Melampsora americana]
MAKTPTCKRKNPQQVTHTKTKTPAPAPPSQQPAERPDQDTTLSTLSDKSEDSPEDASAGTCHPSSNARLNHKITLENYNDLDLDIYTINELLSASGCKTHNCIPSDIQKELKNLQFMYWCSKKLLALAAKCSERTVNKFLEYQNQTKHLSKFSEV